jgi:hypothetical protein
MTLAQTRRGALLAAFLAALTNPTTAGARPIELHAHDALRYVGDMLAWVHQSIAAEHEFLESLFGIAEQRRMVGSVRVGGGAEEDTWIAELMDGAVSGLCPPLKVCPWWAFTGLKSDLLRQEYFKLSGHKITA